jgi:hypothetical protein
MKHEYAAVLATALVLAQLNAPGSYNLGIPATPGTRVPESNPATAITPPSSPAPNSSTAPSAGTAAPAAPIGNTGPAYSFGAAPAPIVSPGR